MEQLLAQIHMVEQKHLKELFNHIVKVFINTKLPSHDALHHLRVWLHCRGLMIELHKAGIEISHDLIESALVACFFHDSGLTIDIGELHGKFGGQICREYYNQQSESKPENIDAIIQAIEFHDDKAAKMSKVSSPKDMICLNRLVSTADDLDALGVIGVFRYIEIYIKRGIPDHELSKKVIQNLKNRFTSFTNSYSSLPRFADKQRIRYQETVAFFTELDLQIIQGVDNPDSQYAVYKILKESLIEKNQSITATINNAQKSLTASYPLRFFHNLKSELDVTSAILLS